MIRRMCNRIVLACCVVLFLVVSVGCGLRANEKTKAEIIAHIHPQLQPVSEFQFVEPSRDGRLEFEFKAADGGMFWGYFDGEMVHATRK